MLRAIFWKSIGFIIETIFIAQCYCEGQSQGRFNKRNLYETLSKRVFKFFIDNAIELALVTLSCNELHNIGLPIEAGLWTNFAVLVGWGTSSWTRLLERVENEQGYVDRAKMVIRSPIGEQCDAFVYSKPVKLVSEKRSYMIIPTTAENQTSRQVQHWLQSVQLIIWNAE